MSVTPDTGRMGLLNEDSEVVVQLADGWSLRSGVYDNDDPEAHTSGEYVRLVDPDGIEYCYWDQAEWHDDPALVMGAIINSAAGFRMIGDDGEYPSGEWARNDADDAATDHRGLHPTDPGDAVPVPPAALEEGDPCPECGEPLEWDNDERMVFCKNDWQHG